MRSPSDSQIAAVTDPATSSWLRSAARAGMRVLEVGCGPAQYRGYVGGRYVGVDITAEDYRPGLPRDPDVVADAYRLPFAPGGFEIVFFAHSFLHFTDAHQALREARRALRPKGILAIFDYTRPTLARLRDSYALSGQDVSVVVRSCADWVRLLRDEGWLQADVRLNSIKPLTRLAMAVAPTSLRHAWIDGREGAIIVTARAS